MQEMGQTQIRSLGQKDPLEEEMAPHSSVLAGRNPWTEEPDGLQSTGLQSWTQLSVWTHSTWACYPAVLKNRQDSVWYGQWCWTLQACKGDIHQTNPILWNLGQLLKWNLVKPGFGKLRFLLWPHYFICGEVFWLISSSMLQLDYCHTRGSSTCTTREKYKLTGSLFSKPSAFP